MEITDKYLRKRANIDDVLKRALYFLKSYYVLCISFMFNVYFGDV